MIFTSAFKVIQSSTSLIHANTGISTRVAPTHTSAHFMRRSAGARQLD
jgi:hypothetical protein